MTKLLLSIVCIVGMLIPNTRATSTTSTTNNTIINVMGYPKKERFSIIFDLLLEFNSFSILKTTP